MCVFVRGIFSTFIGSGELLIRFHLMSKLNRLIYLGHLFRWSPLGHLFRWSPQLPDYTIFYCFLVSDCIFHNKTYLSLVIICIWMS